MTDHRAPAGSYAALHEEAHVLSFDFQPGIPVKSSVIRYSSQPTPPPEGLVLIVVHSVSAHKEQWVPTLRRLFSATDLSSIGPRISEAWAIDAPGHGDSVQLNLHLHESPEILSSLSAYSKAISTLLQTNLSTVHPSRIVAVGHSAGGAALIPAAIEELQRTGSPPFGCAILIEPSAFDRNMFQYVARIQERVRKMALARKDEWPSRAEALRWLRTHPPWSRWDDEVLEILVSKGMRESPSGHSVVLKCSPQLEAATFHFHIEAQFAAGDQLATMCRAMPVHMIFGAVDDYIHAAAKELMVDPKKGRKMASVQRVARANHMAIQTNPRGTAEAIMNVLSQRTLSRL
ncbi:alpha/beta-hydrolase [Dentipellis sp. KUC8613]|nr:alpha/beta-hydrolase [Dentipellis sp. KUC8613]